MLHTETVEATTLVLIQKLCADEQLKDFILVGGTVGKARGLKRLLFGLAAQFCILTLYVRIFEER